MARRNTSRNAAGAGSIRKKTVTRNNTQYTYWEARVTTGYDPGTGKQIQRSITGKTQREVSQKLRELITELDKGTYLPPSKLTLSQWLKTWHEDYLGSVKESTAYLYQENIRLYIDPALGAVKLEALTTPMIQHFYNELASGSKDSKPLSAKTVKNIHGVLHKALQQAVSIGFLRFNPSDACVLPRAGKAQITPLEGEQIPAFLEAIKGHKHQVLYTVALFTGMREGEILGLMWDCVDFDHNTITVDKQLRRSQKKGGEYYFSPPKNNKSRTIMVAPSVMKLLRLHKREQAAQRLAVGPGWIAPSLVFTNEIGDRLSYRTVYDCFKRIVAKIDAPTVRFHDLRHPYVKLTTKKYLLQKQKSQATVADNLGFLFLLYSKRSCTLYSISIRLSGYTRTLSIRRAASAAVRPVASASSFEMLLRWASFSLASCSRFA